jgi:hypothetical protein
MSNKSGRFFGDRFIIEANSHGNFRCGCQLPGGQSARLQAILTASRIVLSSRNQYNANYSDGDAEVISTPFRLFSIKISMTGTE